MTRTSVLAAGAVVAVALNAACAAAPPSPSTAPAAAPAGTSSPATAAPRPEVRTVRISWSDGRASGDTGTVPVLRGERVRIEVTGDVADEAHLHGYDREVRLTPGVPAAIDLTADIPGEFELELHTSGAQLATLQVR